MTRRHTRTALSAALLFASAFVTNALISGSWWWGIICLLLSNAWLMVWCIIEAITRRTGVTSVVVSAPPKHASTGRAVAPRPTQRHRLLT